MEIKDYTNVFTSEDMSIGYIPGSSRVLFIKTGQGGSIYGYENRYLDLAMKVNERYGWSAFVSATIEDSMEAYERDMLLMEQCLGTTEYEIFYLGVSKGGLIGIWYGADNPKIKRMISINAPLMINYHGKTLPSVKKLGRDKLTMIYGSLDPSYKYVPFVEKWTNVEIVKGADHNLSHSPMTFINMFENFLY